jgi:hypothetical protein
MEPFPDGFPSVGVMFSGIVNLTRPDEGVRSESSEEERTWTIPLIGGERRILAEVGEIPCPFPHKSGEGALRGPSPTFLLPLLILAPDELLPPPHLLHGVERSPDSDKRKDARTVARVSAARERASVEVINQVVPFSVAVLLRARRTAGGDLARKVADLFEAVEVEAFGCGRGHGVRWSRSFPVSVSTKVRGGKWNGNSSGSLSGGIPVEYVVEILPFQSRCGDYRKWKLENHKRRSIPSASSKWCAKRPLMSSDA